MNEVLFTLDVTVLDFIIRIVILVLAIIVTIALIISKIIEKHKHHCDDIQECELKGENKCNLMN